MCWGCQLGNASFYPPLRINSCSSRKRTRIPLTGSGSSTQRLATRNRGNNSARQARDTTTETWTAHGNSTWRASKHKVDKLHQSYILKTKQKKKRGCSSGMYTLHFRHARRQRCVQDYFSSRPDIDLVCRALLFLSVCWLDNLVCFLTLKRCNVWQKRCLPSRGEHEFMSSRDISIFSLDTSVSRKDLHVSARHKLVFPSQWETTYIVLSDRNVTPFASTLSQEVNM